MKEEVKLDSEQSTQAAIDSRAVIHPSAKIGKNVTIGPWSVIEANVEIGDNTEIMSHVIVGRNTRMGKNNQVYPFSVIGGYPQDIHHKGNHTRLEVGDNNIIREYVTISRGSAHDRGVTQIGNHNFILAYCHIGHDCVVGSHVLFTNNATIAGHVTVEDHAILGAFTAVHQFCRVGSYSFITRGALVNRDVLPYVLVASHSSETHGLNLIGLQRHGFTEEDIRSLKNAYQLIFRSGKKAQAILEELKAMAQEQPNVQRFVDMIEKSERGYVR